MADRPRSRKRVYGLRRAPDGSAFEKCDFCGASYAVVLADMHECKGKTEYKRLKVEKQTRAILIIEDQPRSPFCFFMESFRKNNNGDYLVLDRKGFEIWKNMTKEERSPFVHQSEKVNSAYDKVLHKEEEDLKFQGDDEPDSLRVEKFDLDHGLLDGCGSLEFGGFDSSGWSEE